GGPAARPPAGPRGHPGHPPAFRLHDHRAGARADGRGAGTRRARRSGGGPRRLPGRMLPSPAGHPRRGPARGPRVTDDAPATLLGLARSAAVEAGGMLAAGRPPGRSGRPEVTGTKSSPTDVVTEMDRASEALITDRLLSQRPGDAVLGEEGGESGRGRVRWIIDPLDGTVNYLYGLADWAVSIAAEVEGTLVAGVVAVPAHDEVFTAVSGGGAWLQAGAAPPVPLRCNTGVTLAQALVATGFGYEAARRKIQGEVVAAVLPRVRDIRRGGSCAVDLCSVAAGRVDAFYERGVNYWD